MNEVIQEQVVRVQEDTQDKWSRWYNFTARFRYPHASPLRRITSLFRELGVSPKGGARILEFGFGHGHLLFWFKPPTAIYGVELSPKAINAADQRAKRRGYSEYGFLRVDVENSTRINCPDNFVDLVLSSHTLEHVWNDEALLQEFHRVLKPGGRLVVVVPHDAMHAEVMPDRETRRNPQFPTASYHVHNYNLETLMHLARSCSFAIEKAERFDAVMSARRRWPRLFTMLFSFTLPLVPYAIFKVVDKRAKDAGYPCMQALIVGTKA